MPRYSLLHIPTLCEVGHLTFESDTARIIYFESIQEANQYLEDNPVVWSTWTDLIIMSGFSIGNYYEDYIDRSHEFMVIEGEE